LNNDRLDNTDFLAMVGCSQKRNYIFCTVNKKELKRWLSQNL
jgi:hypothetical protein